RKLQAYIRYNDELFPQGRGAPSQPAPSQLCSYSISRVHMRTRSRKKAISSKLRYDRDAYTYYMDTQPREAPPSALRNSAACVCMCVCVRTNSDQAYKRTLHLQQQLPCLGSRANTRTVAQLDERVSGELNELRRRQNESSEMLSELQKRMTVFASTVRDPDVTSTSSAPTTPSVDSCEVRVTGIPVTVSAAPRHITITESILNKLQLERLIPLVISVRPWTPGRSDPSHTSSASATTVGVRPAARRERAIVVRPCVSDSTRDFSRCCTDSPKYEDIEHLRAERGHHQPAQLITVTSTCAVPTSPEVLGYTKKEEAYPKSRDPERRSAVQDHKCAKGLPIGSPRIMGLNDRVEPYGNTFTFGNSAMRARGRVCNHGEEIHVRKRDGERRFFAKLASDGRRGRTPAATSSRTGYLRFHQTYDDLFCFSSKGWMRRSVMRATHSSPPRGSILTSRYFHEHSFTSMKMENFGKSDHTIGKLTAAAARVFTCVCCSSSIGDRSRARAYARVVTFTCCSGCASCSMADIICTTRGQIVSRAHMYYTEPGRNTCGALAVNEASETRKNSRALVRTYVIRLLDIAPGARGPIERDDAALHGIPIYTNLRALVVYRNLDTHNSFGVARKTIGRAEPISACLPTVNTPGSTKAPASCTNANARLESITRQNNPRDFQSKPLSHHTSLADSDLPNVTYTTRAWQKNKLIFSALLAAIDVEARANYWKCIELFFLNLDVSQLDARMAAINERLDNFAQTQLKHGAAILQNTRTVAQLDERVSGELNELRRRQNESSEMLSELQRRMTVFASTVRDPDVTSTSSAPTTPSVDSCEVRVTGIPVTVSAPDITITESILNKLQLERLIPLVISVRPWTPGRSDPSHTSSASATTVGVRPAARRERAIVVRLASAIARETFLAAAPTLRSMKTSSIFALNEDTTTSQLNLSPLLPPARVPTSPEVLGYTKREAYPKSRDP
ncbi:unnamed protein product, partial [Trichogramma brassicae]